MATLEPTNLQSRVVCRCSVYPDAGDYAGDYLQFDVAFHRGDIKKAIPLLELSGERIWLSDPETIADWWRGKLKVRHPTTIFRGRLLDIGLPWNHGRLDGALKL